MSLDLFRCLNCDRLIRRREIEKGVCLGHSIKLANKGSLLEWIRVLYWKLTKQF